MLQDIPIVNDTSTRQVWFMPRKSLFDDLQSNPTKNIFCERDDLTNEASVEAFFVVGLLKDLGYRDTQIQTKKSITELTVSLGSKKVKYRPDYALTYRKTPRWILDAKATGESLDEWVPQCSGYCLALNQKYKDKNPVEFFILTNGILTRVYRWDYAEEPLLELTFADFNYGNPNYEQLRRLLSASGLGLRTPEKLQAVESYDFQFDRPTPEHARSIFAQCHDYIWKADKRSPSSAFMEFVKIMFVKLWADKNLRNEEKIAALLESGSKLPSAAVPFSVDWIETREKETLNPIDEIHFKNLRNTIEEEISREKKKRLFDRGEHINLKRQTVQEVVRRLEHHDMFGIDEDLNGRLFETFLNATMRGQALGQFFTPRSIVKLMTYLADLTANEQEMSRVFDACCGSGGFLIEALAVMRDKIRENEGLTIAQREKLIDKLSNYHLYGIDAGVDPEIARIARINMYLHGDGGSRIYFADALDKELESDETEDTEVRLDREELRNSLGRDNLRFDVVLTNPPFAMRYELSNPSEARILKQYELARVDETSNKFRPSLRSSAMFIERYRDLLRPGGILLTVIDDTILSGEEYEFVRTFIRKYFLIRAVISLPGDAFQRAGARVKTSILYLQKKENADDKQPATFMDFSVNLGVDDLTVRASSISVEEARNMAEAEIDRIVANFKKYREGKTGSWLVKPERMVDRLDAKYCIPQQGRFVSIWKRAGYEVQPLSSFVEEVKREIVPQDMPDMEFRLMRVQYNGNCIYHETRKGRDLKYNKMKYVQEWDLVFSNIGAVMGSIGIVPEELDKCVVSSEYTVLRCKSRVDTVYLWTVLRSSELRADLLATSSGLSRHRLKWPQFGEVVVPFLSEEDRKEIHQNYLKTLDFHKKAKQSREQIFLQVNEKLKVESEKSKRRFQASKPPK